MDDLKDKSYKSYNYLSRYSSFPYYYNTKDDKYVYGKTSELKTTTPYTTIKLNQMDTLDSLALKYYGRPDYFWVIADFNRIIDPFIDLYAKFDEIKIPTLTAIEFED